MSFDLALFVVPFALSPFVGLIAFALHRLEQRRRAEAELQRTWLRNGGGR